MDNYSKNMAEQQNLMQNISSILNQLLGSGIALNGQVSISGLTVTSVDKAKELGLLNPQENKSQKEEKQGEQEPQKQQESGQKEQADADQQSPHEELDSLREEVRYLRELMESSQQDQSSQRSKPSSK